MALDRRALVKLLAAGGASSAFARVSAQTPPAQAPAGGGEGGFVRIPEPVPATWEEIRKQFLLLPDEVFFNTATLGSPAKIVLDKMHVTATRLAATQAEWDYKPDSPAWFTGYEPETRLRRKLALIVNCAPEELSLTQNATMGSNFIADGLDLAPGDEVIQTDQEHPGSKSTWEVKAKRHGIVVKVVNVPVPANDAGQIVELVRKAVTPKTKVIAWPHVTSALGVVHPVKEICALAKEKGIFTVLDGAQAIGHVPIDLKDIGCDAYVSSPHKWLLAPAGNGFLFVRKESAPRVWTTLASAEWANEKDPGYRLQQRGTGSLPLLVGLDAAIDFHHRVGAARWRARIKELGDRLRKGLATIPNVTVFSSTNPAMCAGITTWRAGKMTGAAMQDAFWEKARMRPRGINDDWGVRTSTMIYNSEAEVDRLLAIAKDLAKA